MNSKHAKDSGGKPKGAEKRNRKRQRDKAEKTVFVSEIMPVIAMDKETGAGILDTGLLVDMLGIRSKDQNALSDEEHDFDNACFDKLYRIYQGDLKIIALNFPTDTGKQLDYLYYKYGRTENPVLRDLLQKEIDKAIWINQHRTDKEYILFFYAKDRSQHRDMLSTILGTLSRGNIPLVYTLPPDRKREIYFKLNNKCTAI
jgi:hypothetical protein